MIKGRFLSQLILLSSSLVLMGAEAKRGQVATPAAPVAPPPPPPQPKPEVHHRAPAQQAFVPAPPQPTEHEKSSGHDDGAD